MGLSAIDQFEGDFDLLPFAAGVRYGAVPLYPTSEDFQNFACTKEHEQRPEAHWHLEAIRWRTANPGKPLSDGLRDIALATAAAIIKTQREDWRGEIGNWATSAHCDNFGCDHVSHYVSSSYR